MAHEDESHPHDHDHPHHGDIACAIAHGDVPAPVEDRRLVAVFASPVAMELAHVAQHVGYQVLVVDPDPSRSSEPLDRVLDADAAGIDPTTDVVVTDHDRAELGDLLAAVLRCSPRWVGVMGSLRHTAPHVAALRERGLPEELIARVHRPIGLDIGSRTPAEIAVSTVAGLLADRNQRSGGVFGG
jgi:xanthine/CO dehydrogenase XdhC/CoxF family maturation factor